jgi:hypothetical protein
VTLSDDLRTAHDVSPVTVEEIRVRAGRRRRARAAAGAVALAAVAAVTVAVLPGSGHKGRPVVVAPAAGADKETGVYVTLTVADPRVVRGRPLAVEVDIVNATGRSVDEGALCAPPYVSLYLDDGTHSNQAPVAASLCEPGPETPHTMLSPGDHRRTQEVSTDFAVCGQSGGGSPDDSIPPCATGGTPPLPAGPYRLEAEVDGLPPGTMAPPPVTVTLLPHPLSSSSLAGLPAGWGRVAGHLGPGGAAFPDVALSFTDGPITLTTTAIGGVYEIELPPGQWAVRGDHVCARGLTVAAGGWFRDDLIRPLTGCQDLSRR